MSYWTDFRDQLFGAASGAIGLHGEDVLTVSHSIAPTIPLGEEKQSVADPISLFSMLQDFNKSTITSQVASDIKTGHVGGFRRLEHRQPRKDLQHTLYPIFSSFKSNILVDAVKASGATPVSNSDVVFMSTELWYDFGNYGVASPDRYYAQDFNVLLDGFTGYDSTNRPWTGATQITHPHVDQAVLDALPNFYIRYFLISDGKKGTIAGGPSIDVTRLLEIPKNDPAVPLSVWYQDPLKKPFTRVDNHYGSITEVPVALHKPIYPLIPLKLNDKFLRIQPKTTIEYDLYRRVKSLDSFNSQAYRTLSDSLSDEYDEPEPVASEYATVAEFNTAHADWVTERNNKVEADAQTRHVHKSHGANLLRHTQANSELMYRHFEYYADKYTSTVFARAGTGWEALEGIPNNLDPVLDDSGYIFSCGFWTRQELLITKDDGSASVIVDPETGNVVSGTTGVVGLDSKYAFNYSVNSITTTRRMFTNDNGITRELAEGEYCSDITYYDKVALKEVIITLKDGEFPPINDRNWHNSNPRYAGIETPLRLSIYKGTKLGYDVIRIHEFTHWVYTSKEGQTKGNRGLLSQFLIDGKSTTGSYVLPLLPEVVADCKFSTRYIGYQECAHLTYSYAVITNLEWYKSSKFVKVIKIAAIIAVIVITIVTAGAGATLGDIILAAVEQYAIQTLVSVAFKYVLSKLPNSTFAQVLAVVLAVVVTVLTQDVGVIANASAVEIALLVTTIASKFTNVVLEEMSVEEAESSQDEMDAYQEWERNFNKLTEAEALDDDTSATVREAMKLMLFEDASDAIDRSLNLDTIDRSYDMMMEQVFDLDHITY